jgi:hypothetical protein
VRARTLFHRRLAALGADTSNDSTLVCSKSENLSPRRGWPLRERGRAAERVAALSREADIARCPPLCVRLGSGRPARQEPEFGSQFKR